MAIVPVYLCCSDLQTRLPEGNIDMGSTIGSYFGLVFLIAAYSAIRNFHFCPIRQSNRSVYHFRIRVLLFYFGFDGLASISPAYSNMITSLGMQDHFRVWAVA
jgi:ABC-2 type transport system permease protein